MRHTFFVFLAVIAVVLPVGARSQQPPLPAVSDPDQVQGPAASPAGAAALPSAPDAAPSELNGTVTDTNGDLIPGATVVLTAAGPESLQTVTANDSGFFQFTGLKPGGPYRIKVTAKGFEDWSSGPITLNAGQFFGVTDIKLKVQADAASVTVYASTEQIATQQVELEEQQRIFGFIPNFYVVYDSKDAVPLSSKLKFKMAMRAATDPISILGAAFLAGMNQAGDIPGYRQGAIGYGERFGAAYGDGLTDIMFGGAILPSLLHQDPRYFYQGTGTVKSRLLHAMSAPLICRGDNGNQQINFSSLGGDLISASISNTYYPKGDRGTGLIFEGFALSTGERVVSTIVQEFVIKRLTPAAKNR